jgi:diacylglycerol kinase (ATP)
MAQRVSVIVNPAAGRGRGAAMVADISARFAEVGVTDVRTTEKKGDERRIAEEAIREGGDTIVVVGGDGTTTNVANAILHSGVDTRLAVIPAGTGNDFAKVLGTAKADLATIARLATERSEWRVDVGRIEDLFFLNCCGFGFDVAVLEAIDRARWLRGNAVYMYTALAQLLRYRGIELALSSDAMSRSSAVHMLLVIANSEYFGGMFRIAPGASVTDGLLDAVAILDIQPLRRVSVFAAAVKGEHLELEQCAHERAASFEVSFPLPPVYETDGELHRARSSSVRVSSCPSALRVIVNPR